MEITTPNQTVNRSFIRNLFTGGCVIMVLLAIIVPGIVSTVLAVQMWHQFQLLSQTGITTQASVTDLSESSDDDGTSYYVHYRFVAYDHFYVESDSVSYDKYKTLDLGQQVTIRYAMNDPTVSHFGAQVSPFAAIFLTLFSVVWNGFLIFGFRICSGTH